MERGASEIEVLRAFVEAHAQPYPGRATREPIMYLRHLGGSSLEHHALKDPPTGVDEALLEDMHAKGLVSIDFREHTWNITPTEFGRSVIEESDRVNNPAALADVQLLKEAAKQQAEAPNPLGWPVVRPVLAALRTYWHDAGFPRHGIPLLAAASALPDESVPLFSATIRALVEGGYLAPTGSLAVVVVDDQGRTTELQGEVALTEKAHAILDGWPGAAPEELVENLLAVLTAAAADETDPAKKRRLEKLTETIREVGVSVTSEVIAKVVTGGLM